MKFSRDYARTGGVGDRETTELDRRSADSVKLHGRVKEVDYKRSPPAYRIEFGDEKDEDNYILTDWLPAGGARAKGDRETHFLEVGEKVSVFHEGGELSTGFVMPGGIFNSENEDEKATTDKAGVWKKQFKNGAEVSYDRETGAMTLNATESGDVTISGGGCSITMKSGVITLKASKIVTDGETHLGGDGGKLVHRKDDLDSDGDAAVGSASKVFAL